MLNNNNTIFFFYFEEEKDRKYLLYNIRTGEKKEKYVLIHI